MAEISVIGSTKAEFISKYNGYSVELSNAPEGTLVVDKDGEKIGSRKGNSVFLEDILQEAINKSKKIVEEKRNWIINKLEDYENLEKLLQANRNSYNRAIIISESVFSMDGDIADIDKLVYDYTTAHGGIPAPLGYEGFPKSVCTSR